MFQISIDESVILILNIFLITFESLFLLRTLNKMVYNIDTCMK